MTPHPLRRTARLLAYALIALALPAAHAADKHVLLMAGTPSHPPGAHEYNAGVLLWQQCLAPVAGLKVDVALNGWPKDEALLEGADAIVIFCDGEANHLALAGDHAARLDKILSRGVGLGFVHYAVEPAKDAGQEEFLRWVGGEFKINWSVNPMWDADFASLPSHPITRGVHPFRLRDEWYFNLKFVDGLRGVTPLLVAVPPTSSMHRPDGPHEGNPAARAAVARAEPQTLAWAYERADGGRGFGFTGGHFHHNWGDDNVRKLMLNAILWLAKMDVPPEGVESHVTEAELAAHLDPKPAAKKK